MALFLLTLPAEIGTAYDKKAVVVEADDAATAKAMAESLHDGPWLGSSATTIAAQSDDLAGWTCRVRIGPDPTDSDAFEDIVDVSVVAVATDDIDDVGGDLVTALNATAEVANASYSTPTLTIAAGSGGDDLGDHSVRVEMTPPGGSKPVAEMIGTITDGGDATDDLTVVLDAQTAVPNIQATVDKL